MNIKLLSVILIAFTVTCCKEEEPLDDNGLPFFTTEGKNTFGCLIDGKPFVADTKFTIGGAVPVSGSFDESTKFLHINGTREDSNENLEDVRFKVYVDSDISTYTMDVNTENYMGY